MKGEMEMLKTESEAKVTLTHKRKIGEIKREQRLDQAAFDLTDEIWPIRDKLDKACLLLVELTNEYFRKYSKDDQKDSLGIIMEFSRNATFADIIDDYVFQAKKALEALEERARKVMEVRIDERRNQNTSH
jgi:NTP pyrophosphatase (non-canonical NTP hydrolase)